MPIFDAKWLATKVSVVLYTSVQIYWEETFLTFFFFLLTTPKLTDLQAFFPRRRIFWFDPNFFLREKQFSSLFVFFFLLKLKSIFYYDLLSPKTFTIYPFLKRGLPPTTRAHRATMDGQKRHKIICSVKQIIYPTLTKNRERC